MAVLTTSLTTLTNLKSFLGITTSDQDTKLEKTIDRVSAWIENVCDRKFKARKYNNGGSTHSTTLIADEDYIYFDGSTIDNGGETTVDERGLGVFQLPQYPVQANSVLTFALAVLLDREAATWDTDDYVENSEYVVDRERGLLRLLGGIFQPGIRNYRITMAAGYVTNAAQPYVPDDLEQLCLELCRRIHEDRTNLQSESIGSWSRTFNTAKEDPFVADIFAKYSKISL